MCGRFVLTTTTDQIQQIFGVDDVPSISPRYNIAPTQGVLVIRQNGGGSRYAGMLRWGLIPHWAKDPAIGNKMINARSETAHEKPSSRNPVRYHRCLIPASGFIEWEQQNGGKQPWYIHRKDGDLLAFAGIWESWKGPEGIIETCSILTTSANALVAKIQPQRNRGVRDSQFSKNKSGKYLTLQIEVDGERRVVFTGSDVLIEQLERYAEMIPFEATIKKIDKFFTLS